jgi:hypothetical protein
MSKKKYQEQVYEPLQFELGTRRCCSVEILSHACMLRHVQMSYRVASTMIQALKDLSMYVIWLVEPLGCDQHRSIYANT